MRRQPKLLTSPVMGSLPAQWLSSAVIVVLATVVLQFIRQTVGLEVTNVSLGYIVAVLVVAITYGLGPGVLASVLAFIAYIFFFFVPPLHTFSVATSQDLIRLFLFLGVAMVTSSIAARSRARAEEARHRALIQEALYGLSQAISTEVAAEAILPTIAEQIMGLLHADGCVILLSSGNTLRPTVTVGRVGDAIVNPLHHASATDEQPIHVAPPVRTPRAA